MQLLTVTEVSKILRVNRRTVYKLIKSGRIQAKRVGLFWRIPEEELEKFIVSEWRKSQRIGERKCNQEIGIFK